MRRILLVATTLLLGGCTTTQVIPSGEVASVAPMLSVERFLQASNNRDGAAIETGGTFGCAFKKLGSWIGIGQRCSTLQEVELRMDAIARILRHQDYAVVSEAPVAGRVHPTSRIGVNLQIGNDTVEDVPFIVVRTGEGRWLVEQIGLDEITGRR